MEPTSDENRPSRGVTRFWPVHGMPAPVRDDESPEPSNGALSGDTEVVPLGTRRGLDAPPGAGNAGRGWTPGFMSGDLAAPRHGGPPVPSAPVEPPAVFGPLSSGSLGRPGPRATIAVPLPLRGEQADPGGTEVAPAGDDRPVVFGGTSLGGGAARGLGIASPVAGSSPGSASGGGAVASGWAAGPVSGAPGRSEEDPRFTEQDGATAVPAQRLDEPAVSRFDDPRPAPLDEPHPARFDGPGAPRLDGPISSPVGEPEEPEDRPLGEPLDRPLDEPLDRPLDRPLDEPLGHRPEPPFDGPSEGPVDQLEPVIEPALMDDEPEPDSGHRSTSLADAGFGHRPADRRPAPDLDGATADRTATYPDLGEAPTQVGVADRHEPATPHEAAFPHHASRDEPAAAQTSHEPAASHETTAQHEPAPHETTASHGMTASREPDAPHETIASFEPETSPQTGTGARTETSAQAGAGAQPDESAAHVDTSAAPAAPGGEPAVPAVRADGPLRPGDVDQGKIMFWDDEAIDHFRSSWHEVKADFVDDPVTALTRAHDLLTEAVNELTESLLAERDELDPLDGRSTPDTESMRMAMRGYREFLDRILAL